MRATGESLTSGGRGLRGSWARLVSVGLLLGVAGGLRAELPPLTKEEQARVDAAIERGVKYLKRVQNRSGTWNPESDLGRTGAGAGWTILPAYSLLECGVRRTDPAVQKVAALLRKRSSRIDQTYDLGLAILFFDRLGDTQDAGLIRTFALRLIAGQNDIGGWTYRCPLLTADQEKELLGVLRNLDTKNPPEGAAVKRIAIPRDLKTLAIFRDLILGDPPPGGALGAGHRPRDPIPVRAKEKRDQLKLAGDNSNTQFAALGVWVAQRYGVPIKRTFALLSAGYEKSQFPDGSWAYRFLFDERATLHSRAMTCAGLLGLAIGRGLKVTEEKADMVDDRIIKGLLVLYRNIGVPTGQMRRRLRQPDLYFLWSLERVAVLYKLRTLGDKEWYRWGVEILVTNQGRDGSWPGSPNDPRDFVAHNRPVQSYGGPVNTSFALLFLKRSHPINDLTARLPYDPEWISKQLLSGGAALKPEVQSSERDSRRENRSSP